MLITADGFFRRGSLIDLKSVADAAIALSPTVTQCVVWRRAGNDIAWRTGRDHWWHDVITEGEPLEAAVDTASNDPYMIIYTSGTTGRPKGALHVQSGFPIKAAHDMALCFDVGRNDTVFWVTDLGWMMGPWLICGGLLLGASIVLFEGTPDYPNPGRLWQVAEASGATVLGVAPTAVRVLMTQGDSWVNDADLSRLRILGSSGEPWNPGPWQWYLDVVGGGRCPIINYSGGTETSGGIVTSLPTGAMKPCGFTGPVPGMDADVLNEAGDPVRGAVGELVVRQPWVGMTRGFWNDRQRYEDTYWSRFPGIWVHGDWAEVDEDGSWFIRGRSDDTLKVAGKRVGPAEVESAAVTHPAVQEAAAIGVPDEIKGETIVVFVVLQTGVARTDQLEEEIRRDIGKQLGAALRPAAVHVVAELPKTRNAKVMRRVIRAAYLGVPAGDTTALENPGAVEGVAAARPDVKGDTRLMNRESLQGVQAGWREARVPEKEREERRRLALEWGLESAWSITDRTIPLFNRNNVAGKFSSSSTFLGVPFPAGYASARWTGCRFRGCSARCWHHLPTRREIRTEWHSSRHIARAWLQLRNGRRSL